MNTGTTMILALLLGGGAGAATSMLARDDARASTSGAEAAPAPAPEPRDAELERSVADLRSALDELRTELSMQRSERVPLSEIEAAVGRWMSANAPAAPAAETPSVAHSEALAPARRPLADLLTELDAPGLTDERWDQLWREIAASGQVDEALAWFEARAESDPQNPDRHVELAAAYLGKLQTVGQGVEAGTLATKADAAFDRALELDDHHWEGRFMKAMSLSFWPPIFGKQGEAIRNFEILVEQQRNAPRTEKHAQTFLFLGNLYQQTGEAEKASAIWQQGLALFPDNGELLGKAGASE